jgi:hypothetical protein
MRRNWFHYMYGRLFMESLKDLQTRYDSLKSLGLKLNIERGQPGDDNFDLSNALFSIVTEKDIKTESGFDIRNYPRSLKKPWSAITPVFLFSPMYLCGHYFEA